MPFGFVNLPAKVSSRDGLNVILLDYLEYEAKDGTRYRCIPGSASDGASTPPEIWIKYPPFGTYWPAAVLHDCCYRTTIEKLMPSGQWIRIAADKNLADSLLLEAMESLGVSEFDRQAIYNAVKDFGDSAYIGDMAQPIP